MKIRGSVLLLATLFSLAGVASAEAAGRLAYVSNYDSNQIVAMDTATDTILPGAVTTVDSPYMAAISPDGRTMYVPDFSNDRVFPVDLTTGTTGTPITTDLEPVMVAFTPDGKKAYVANFDGNSVQAIDVASGTVGHPIPVGTDPYSLAITPDGSSVWVANYGSGNITVIDTSTDQVVGSPITTANGPYSLAISPDGGKAYVANYADDNLQVIDVASRQIVGDPIPTAVDPGWVTVSPEGKTIWVVSQLDDSVQPFNANTLAPIGGPIDVGLFPYAMALMPDGSRGYASASNVDALTGIDALSYSATGSVEGFDNPWQINIAPNQPPVAIASVPIRAEAGKRTVFDASNSTDTDGHILRYEWEFGDGKGTPDGGKTVGHIYRRPGTYPVTLTLTDNEGCSTRYISSGLVTYCNGGQAATQTESVRVTLPRNNFSFGRVKLIRKRRAATIQVKLPGPGVVKVAGKGVRKAKKSARKAGRIAVPVKFTSQANRVRVKVTFTPKYGKPRTKTKPVRLPGI